MRILFGVFDWGLGHATRDIPLIEALLKKNHQVHIVSTGRALALLRKHFGNNCVYFDVPSVKNPYTKTRFFTLSFIRYAPEMVRSLKKARKQVVAILHKQKYDRVISDSRYDVYDRVENSFFINHQLRFLTFAGAQRIIENWQAARQKRYKYILVPDFERNDLSGRLSHQIRAIDKKKIKYIGVLSQMQKKNCKKDIDCFISISGPEPQRTLLESQILNEAGKLKGNVLITLGKPEKQRTVKRGNITIKNFLNTQQQQDALSRAKVVVTRSGYTTMMELYELRIQHALLIPTPGQTEQEYLADLYEERGQFHHVSQYELDLVHDIAKAKKGKGFTQQGKTRDAVQKFIKLIDV